ncbi:unnamed protein product [Rotaria socialis]
MVTLQVEIDTQIEFKRTLPWWQLLAIGLGAIIGIFCAFFSGFCPVDILGETTSIGALVSYIFAHVSVVVMRFTHKDMPRGFKVPCGKWLIPTVGSLLSVLLLKGVSKATGFRFLAWTLLGQVIYFSYGYWHSKRRELSRNDSINSMIELTANHEITTENCTPGEVDMGLASVHSENQA